MFWLIIESILTLILIHGCNLSFRPLEGDAERQQSLGVNVVDPEVTVIPDRPRDSQVSDSDSDGPILYRDEEDEEEEEDDEYTNSMG